MKKFIYFFLFFLVSLAANSQVQRPANTPSPNSPTGYSLLGYSRADSGFIWGKRDTFPAKFPTIIWHTNGNFYKSNGNGGAWSLFASSTAGTVSSVSGNAPISVANGTTTPTISADTSYNGLATKKWLYKTVDSLGFIKLNISDTAAMLLTRLKVSDTAYMLSGYLRESDTSAMLSNYVPISRTITTNAPLFGGGNLSTNRTFGIDTGRAIAQVVTGGSLTAVKDSLLSVIASSGGGTVLSVSTTNGVGINSSVATATSTPNITIAVDTFAISTRDWRNKGVDSAISVIPLRITDSLAAVNRIKAGGSGGVIFQTNSGATAFSYGAGGSQEVDFHGFAGYDANRSSTYTVRSFTDKRYVDSSLALRLLIGDTATMLSPYRRTTTKITNSDLVNSTISGIALGSNLNNLSAGNGLSGTAYNGSAAQTWQVDTSIISTKANVTGLLVGYATTGSVATKLNISDTASMLSNYRRKTTLIENADLRNSAITINGSSTALGGSISVGTVTSVAASAGTGISVSGSPITGSGTLTITNTAPDQTVTLTAGSGISVSGTYPNFTITNSSPSSGGTVTSVSAGTGMSFTTITSSGAVNADTTVLATRAYAAGLDVAKANTSLNNVNGVLSSTYGGAGSVSGILKANGSGVVSAAVAGTDYVAPSSLSGYLPLTAGSGQSLSGDLYVTKDNPKIFLTDNAGGAQNNYSINSNFGFFNINDETAGGASFFSYGGGQFTLTGLLSGTSLSMSGGGIFGGDLGIGTASPLLRLQVAAASASTFATQFTTNDFVNSSTGTRTLFGFNAASGNTYSTIQSDNNGGLTATSLALNPNSGDVLIAGAVTDGTNKLIVNGSSKFTSSSTGGYVGLTIANTNTGAAQIALNNSAQSWYVNTRTDNAFSVFNNTSSTTPFLIATSGAATFSGQINGTSLSMSGGATIGTRVLAGSSSNTTNAFSGTNNSVAEATIYSFNNAATGYSIFSGQGINYFKDDVLINTTTTDGTNKLIVNGGVKFKDAVFDNGLGRITTEGFAARNIIYSTTANFAAYNSLRLQAADWSFHNATSEVASISGSGAATFSSTVTMPYLSIATGSNVVANINSSNATGGYLTWQTNGTTIADLGTATQVFGSGGSEVFAINGRGARAIAFGTNNTERARIATDGTFLINTTTTDGTNKLIVNGGVKGTTGDFTTSIVSGSITNIANGTGVYSALGATNTSSTASLFVGVGGSSVANTPLRNNAYVMNTANSSLVLGTNDQARLTIDNTGAATFSSSVTATSFFESSDKRKKDIFSVTKQEDGIDFIGFKWKKELNLDNKTHLGVIAQQVEKVLPDAVTTDEKGYKSVNYTEVLIYKLENLTKKVEELEQKLERYSKKAKTKN